MMIYLDANSSKIFLKTAKVQCKLTSSTSGFQEIRQTKYLQTVEFQGDDKIAEM